MKKGMIIIPALLLIVLTCLVLAGGSKRFRLDAPGTLELYLGQDRFLDSTGLTRLPEGTLRIELLPGTTDLQALEKELKEEGSYLIHSEDEILARKSWIWLRQMGHGNVYVLLDRDPVEDEILKYSFIPDSSRLISHKDSLPEYLP